jgi:hypothetical protein
MRKVYLVGRAQVRLIVPGSRPVVLQLKFRAAGLDAVADGVLTAGDAMDVFELIRRVARRSPQATEPAQDEALMLPGRLVVAVFVPLRAKPFNFQLCGGHSFLEDLLDPVIVGGWRELVCPQPDRLFNC